MKKTIFVTLLAAMMLFAFTACNDNPSSGWNIGARKAVVEAIEGDTDKTVAYAANLEKTTVEVKNNVIVISADIEALTTCNSSNTTEQGKGPAKWVGVLINTGLSSIVDAKVNGTALTEADATEAKSVGANDSEFVLWVRADKYESDYPRTFTLADKDGNLTVFGVEIVNTHSADQGDNT